MSAFTPGPWRAEKHGLITAEVSGVRRQVASVQGDAVMHGDPSVDVVSLQQANAKPMALWGVEALVRQRDEAAGVLRKARTLLPQLREQLSEFAHQELTSLLDDPFEWEGDK